MPRRSKTERTGHVVGVEGADRVLVVDDHPDAGRLLGKLVRRAGFEVAELNDSNVAVATLVNEPRPVGAVVASFTTTGTRACLRLLDAIRTNDEPRIAGLRVLLVSDQPRQQIFCFQAGADAILLRPYHSDDLVAELREMLARPDRERARYRSEQVERLKASMSHPLDPRQGGPAAVAAH